MIAPDGEFAAEEPGGGEINCIRICKILNKNFEKIAFLSCLGDQHGFVSIVS